VLSIFRSASFLRTRNLATPAASSMIILFSSGRAFTIVMIFPCSMMAYPRAPAPVSRKSSAMSFSRQGIRLMKNSLSPSRKVRRVTCTSAYDSYPGGANPSSLLNVRETSAIPRGPAASDPAKITSSKALLRRYEGACSPSTQRMASTMFDFPHPLGPTIAVMPSEKSKLVLS